MSAQLPVRKGKMHPLHTRCGGESELGMTVPFRTTRCGVAHAVAVLFLRPCSFGIRGRVPGVLISLPEATAKLAGRLQASNERDTNETKKMPCSRRGYGGRKDRDTYFGSGQR